MSTVALLVVAFWGLAPSSAQEDEPPFAGLDSAINESLAEEAGVPARDPYINTEAMGELWNLILLVAGGVCGFIIGRYWDRMFGRSKPQGG
ncbi:MAG TPA: hypothetical protein VGC50_00970 [Gammaproteobacteria bacterium]